MRRLAIVEYIMSAGGVERVLKGLAGAFLEIPEAREWDITFLLGRYNSAGHRCEWPKNLAGPKLHVEWLGENSAASRTIDPIARGRFEASRFGHGLALAAHVVRGFGPAAWRAWLGDHFSLIARASRRFDLLYFTYPFGMGVPNLEAPVVTTPQDFNFKHFLPEGSRARRLQERTTRAWLTRSDRILFSSQAVYDEMVHFYPDCVPRSQVVPLGVDPTVREPSPGEVEEIKGRLALPAEFLLVSGWVVPHKNQLAVVAAIAELRRRGIALPVVFVGPNAAHLADAKARGVKGDYLDSVSEALRAAKLVHGRDYFAPGYVSDAELQALFRLATLYVLPSLYEGFGLPSLEALLAGCPTIVSSIPPLEEQNRALGGILRTFNPTEPLALASEIEWVYRHRDEAGAAARLAAQRIPVVYDWRRTARSYLAAFEEVISSKPLPGRARGTGLPP